MSGVTDVRHLKNIIRDDDRHKVNSPWNIAADFNVDMSLSKQGIAGMLSNYPELRKRLRAILMEGTRYTYNALQEPLEQMEAYGLIRNDHNTVKISNRIFEMLLYNLFLSDEELRDKKPGRKESTGRG